MTLHTCLTIFLYPKKSMKYKIRNEFRSIARDYGVDSAIVLISSETLITLYGGSVLFEMGLQILIPPLALLPISLFSILPIYIVLRKIIKRSLL